MNVLDYDIVIVDRKTGDLKWTVKEIAEAREPSVDPAPASVFPVIPIESAARKHSPVSDGSPMEQSLIADLEETFGPMEGG